MTTETPSHKENMNIPFFLVLGTIIIIGLGGAVLWVQSLATKFADDTTSNTTYSTQKTELGLASASEAEANEAGAEVDMDAVISAVNNGGCIACHTIPDVPDAVGIIGPDLTTIGANAASRIEGYEAEQYIRESLLDPNAFTAPECPNGPCPAGTMPELTLDSSEIDTLVNYLSTLGVE